MAGLQPSSLKDRRATGARLRQWRLTRQSSQSTVAHAVCITQASLSNYETGKRQLSVETALRLASALQIGLSELLDTPDVLVGREPRLEPVVHLLVARPGLLDAIESGA